jgi:hypothetical protein
MTMKKTISFASIAFSLALTLTGAGHSAEPTDKLVVNTAFTGADMVNQFKGKRVTLVLRSGKEIEGTVGESSTWNVEIKSLAGKEFYDALVRVEDIAAIVHRAR